MPPAPEFRDGGTGIGGVEVLREPEAQQQGYSDGHVAIAREVAIDLHGIAIDAQKCLDAGIEGGIVEDAVHIVERDIVADDGFLEKTDEDEEHSFAHHTGGNGEWTVNLRYEFAGLDDRACHQLWKETHEEGIVEQSRERFDMASVDVDGIAHRLEREEADTHGQENVPRLKVVADDLANGAEEEVGVFEIAEQGEVDDHTEGHHPLSSPFAPLVAQPSHLCADKPVADGDHSQQEEIETAALVIEIVGEERHE